MGYARAGRGLAVLGLAAAAVGVVPAGGASAAALSATLTIDRYAPLVPQWDGRLVPQLSGTVTCSSGTAYTDVYGDLYQGGRYAYGSAYVSPCAPWQASYYSYSTGFATGAASAYASGTVQDWSTGESVAVSASRTVTVVRCTRLGTAGDDLLTGTSGNDVICGLEGDDRIRGLGGNDVVIGGPGLDTVDFATSPAAVVANLVSGTATGEGSDQLQQVERIDGSRYADTLTGDAGPNELRAGVGNDKVSGGGGDDLVYGGDGNDSLFLGTGNDVGGGGAGTDTVGFALAINADLTAGTATGEGDDVLQTLENITGTPAADRLRGSSGNNHLQGLGGNDTLIGEAGTDRCDGGTGTDTATTCETRIAIP
ncbi:calcium-binding protein [Vallicoccus soli]|uniref:Calcium-binding protein n=1 Tax=Vallicoccus soli TaxID=2339232 RepID=A0A3A3YY10_9ACTN|nr:calcium-binding protein [Vallicoccus soli]RJK92927.1 calcium-binding protein [Vallicoccus soli]